MPATLPWTLDQTVAPKLVPLIDYFVKLLRAGINEVKWNHYQKWSIFITRYSKAQAGTHAAAMRQMHGSSTEKE